jgi:hypothetical protein
MISFRDYLTEPPKIQCGIPHGVKSSWRLYEELHSEPFHFIVPKESRDDYVGRSIYPGVIKVSSFGRDDRFLVHRGIDKEPMEFNNFEAAKMHAMKHRIQEKRRVNQIHDSLSRHYHKAQEKFEPHLKMYGKGSSELNYKLLYGEVPEQAIKLDHAMNHQHTSDSMVVYSGISNNHATKVHTNNVVDHPAFLSTSIDLDTAASFSVMQSSTSILKIHVPAGHPGIYVGDAGTHPYEREFLLPRGLKLRIHHDKETTLKGDEMDLHIHHATIEP